MTASYNPLVYIVSAPSGSGKSTLVNKLLEEIPDLDFSISYTTRAPRGHEQNGKQYYFVPRPEFEKMIRDDEFLEFAQVFGSDGDYYGTAKCFLREAESHGHDLLLDIDVQGAKQIKQKLPEAVSIFILPPGRQTLELRLRNRGEDSAAVIERRLSAATREIANYDKYDYILVNDKLEESDLCLQAIVLSERLRRSQRTLSEQEKSRAENLWQLAESCRLANMHQRVQPILLSFGAPAPSAQS
jgi:guanylate kinase